MKLRLPTMGLLCVRGPDAHSFLQGQLTCDLNLLTYDNSLLGAYLNQKGRMIATFRIFMWQESYWLRMPQEVIPLMMKTLQHFALFSKLTLEDTSAEFAILGVTEVAVTPSQEIKIVSLAENRFEIIAKKSQLDSLENVLATDTAPSSLWDELDILAGIPTVYLATQQQFLPHQLHYDDLGVSFNKGCYLGQEIVARMHYRGQLKQHLYQVQIATSDHLTVGMPLLAASTNREIGELVMFVVKPSQPTLALATLMDEQAIDQWIFIAGIPCEITIIQRC